VKKALALGIDDFRRVREGDYFYIDKSLMIKDFIEYRKYVSLITRPRRFGKSLNISMLREFFDITKDSRSIFQDLSIMKTEYAKQLNSIPIIHVTFKNCSGNSIRELKESLANIMWEEYLRYEDIFRSSVDRKSNSYYRFYQTYDSLKEGEIRDSLLKSSLSELIKAVSIYYGIRPIVLIDEYDHPLIKAHEKGFREEFITIYGSFLGEALKGNQYLEQALITGIQRVAKESIFSELNNFVVYTVQSEQYARYFGLTEEETGKALEHYEEELRDDVRLYYDGYIFGDVNIYNPWSILYYLDTKKIKPYWINTSTNSLIKESIKSADDDFMKAFERLIMDGEVEVSVNLEASFIELATTKTLWGLLVNSGYLTVTKEYASQMKRLKIPNLEVKDEFRGIVASYARLSNDKLDELFDALIERNMDKFLVIYQSLVYEYVSMYDIKENSYHMLFLGMAISVSGMYRITSNIESGDGRSDIVLESLQPEVRPHMVFELKQGENVERLKQEALNQILEKKYYVNLKGRVLCVGIAHDKKRCVIASREIMND